MTRFLAHSSYQSNQDTNYDDAEHEAQYQNGIQVRADDQHQKSIFNQTMTDA